MLSGGNDFGVGAFERSASAEKGDALGGATTGGFVVRSTEVRSEGCCWWAAGGAAEGGRELFERLLAGELASPLCLSTGAVAREAEGGRLGAPALYPAEEDERSTTTS